VEWLSEVSELEKFLEPGKLLVVQVVLPLVGWGGGGGGGYKALYLQTETG